MSKFQSLELGVLQISKATRQFVSRRFETKLRGIFARRMRRVTDQTMDDAIHTHRYTESAPRCHLLEHCHMSSHGRVPANLRVCSSGCCTPANKKCLCPLINYRLVNVLFQPVFPRRVRQRFSTANRVLSDFIPRETPCFHSISLCKASIRLFQSREFSQKRRQNAEICRNCLSKAECTQSSAKIEESAPRSCGSRIFFWRRFTKFSFLQNESHGVEGWGSSDRGCARRQCVYQRVISWQDVTGLANPELEAWVQLTRRLEPANCQLSSDVAVAPREFARHSLSDRRLFSIARDSEFSGRRVSRRDETRARSLRDARAPIA